MKFTYLVVLSLALTAFAQSPAKPAKPIIPTRAEQGFTMLNATVIVHDEVGDGVPRKPAFIAGFGHGPRVLLFSRPVRASPDPGV
jgi:hypothetical protein